jgi:hypothetical protein
MQTEVSLSRAHSTDEIGYVTQHFRDLQGLRLAVVWGIALAFGLLPTRWIHKPGQAIVLFLAAISIGALSFFFMPRWYQDRYGFLAHSTSPQYHLLSLKIGLFTLLAIFFSCMFFANGAQLGKLLIPGLSILGMGLFFMVRACEKVPSIPSIQVRRALALLVVATAAASILHIFIGSWSSNRLFLPTITALFFAYLYDHWLLQHLLRRKRGPEMFHD